MASPRSVGATPAPARAQAHVTAAVIVFGRSTYTFAADHAVSAPSSSATQIPACGRCARYFVRSIQASSTVLSRSNSCAIEGIVARSSVARRSNCAGVTIS